MKEFSDIAYTKNTNLYLAGVVNIIDLLVQLLAYLLLALFAVTLLLITWKMQIY